MNYQDSHAYMKPPATRATDMYGTKATLTNAQELLGNGLVNMSQAITDHALRIDELREDHENLRALLTWIAEVHPDVIKQHYALKDIERANK